MKVVLAILLVTVLLLPAFSRGVQVTPDGIHYTGIAENLAKGNGLRMWDGTYNFAHPPGYGILLAPFRALGFPRKEAVLLLHMVSLLVIFFCAYSLSLLRKTLSDWTAMAAAALVTASPALAGSALYALSEVTFVAFVMLFIWAVSDKRIWLAAVLALVVCGVRYNGLTVVLAVALTLPRWRDRLWVAGPSLAVLLAGVIATGAYRPYLFTKAHMPNWSSMLTLPWDVAAYAGGFVMLIILGYVVWQWRREPAAAAAIGYYVGLVGAASVFGSWVTGERLQAPGVALALVAVFGVLKTDPLNMRLRRLTMIGFAAFCVYGYAQHWQTVKQNGWLSFADPVHCMVAMPEMQKVPVGQIYSNAPDYVWYHTGVITKATPAPESVGTLPPTARVFFFPLADHRNRKNSHYHQAAEYAGVTDLTVNFKDGSKMLRFGQPGPQE